MGLCDVIWVIRIAVLPVLLTAHLQWVRMLEEGPHPLGYGRFSPASQPFQPAAFPLPAFTVLFPVQLPEW